ncbi:efflux RND transporter permease subunit, partial [Microvirga sp. 3-52]|nr:efflux RND transporter permease subunit [Microvirga sp. 3-52]
VSMPGEPIETNEGMQLTTRIVSMLTSVDDIRDLTVAVNPANGKKIKISDVGEVKLAEAPSTTETRANEEPAVLMSVL